MEFVNGLPLLNVIANNGSAVILLAHAAHSKITSPEGFDLHMSAPDIPGWIAPPFIEWANAVLYASHDGNQRVSWRNGTMSCCPLSWGNCRRCIDLGLLGYSEEDLARLGNRKATTQKLRAKDRPLENDFISAEEFDRLLLAWFGNAARVMKPWASFYIWGVTSVRVA